MKRLACLATVVLAGCAAYKMDSVGVGYDDGPVARAATKDKGPLVTVTHTIVSSAPNANAEVKANRALADKKAALRCGKEGLKAEFLSTNENSAEVDISWVAGRSSTATIQYLYACIAAD